MGRYVYVEDDQDRAMQERGYISENAAKQALGRTANGLTVLTIHSGLEMIERHGQRWFSEEHVRTIQRGGSPLEQREAEHAAHYGAAMGRMLDEPSKRPEFDPGMESLQKFGGGR